MTPAYTITTTRRRFAVGRNGDVLAYCLSLTDAVTVRDALNATLPTDRS